MFFQGAIHLTCFRHLFIDEMTHSLEMLIYLNFGNIPITPFLVSAGIKNISSIMDEEILNV